MINNFLLETFMCESYFSRLYIPSSYTLVLDKIQSILKSNLTRTYIFHTFKLRLENQIRLSRITLHVK